MKGTPKIFSPALCNTLHNAPPPRQARRTPCLAGPRLELLAAIADTGSISAAARRLGISYRGAWNSVEAINNLSTEAVVERVAGGSHGGGTRLTAAGERLLHAGRAVEANVRHLLDSLDVEGSDFANFFNHIRTWNMKSSARNQLLGTVVRLQRGAVNAEVRLDLDGDASLTAIITNDAVDDLGLATGKPAIALIKASSVILVADDAIRSSARNHLRGTVTRILAGPVNAEVLIDVGGKTIAAVVTQESVGVLGLVTGSEVTALIKASSVILAIAA